MTRDEFDHQRGRPCSHCGGHVDLEHNPNNNAISVVCVSSDCKRRKTPWGGLVVNIKQNTKKNRKDYPMGQGLYEVWERFKNRCAVCTLPMDAIVELRIGISNHHVTERYDAHEYDCPIIPICNGCKSFVDGRQREAWRWYRRVLELKREPVFPGSPGVSSPRVPSHPMRAEGQASARAVEGFPDDDADA